jgi:hypothetical protein
MRRYKTNITGYPSIAVFQIRSQIQRIRKFFGLPDPDPLVISTDPDPIPDPDTYIIKQNLKENP